MAMRLTIERARSLRMRAQGLDIRAADGTVAERVLQAVRACGGIQAQDLQASHLAVRARAEGVTQRDVTAICDAGDRVVRSWFMRGTLHMEPRRDAPWLTALLGPVTIAKYKGRRAALGLDDTLCKAALAALPTVLADGPLDRSHIVAALRDHGVAIPATGQAPAHLVIYAACSGVIRRGPERGSKPTYVLCDQPQQPCADETDASGAVLLARRYFSAFGPAGLDDFVAWSGLSVQTCRTAIGSILGELTEVSVEDRLMWVSPAALDSVPETSADAWRLVPAFDTYLVGYRKRELLIDPAASRLIYAGGGWIHPAVVRDGQVVGSWRLKRQGAAVQVEVTSFGRGAVSHDGLAAEVADIGNFLQLPAMLHMVDNH